MNYKSLAFLIDTHCVCACVCGGVIDRESNKRQRGERERKSRVSELNVSAV